MRRLLLLLFVSVPLAGHAVADDPAPDVTVIVDAPAAEPAAEEPPKTVEEALAKLAAQMAAANQQAIGHLDAIARRAVAEGQLGEAAKAWEEVLRLAPEHETAWAFFSAIGRTDVLQENIDESKKPTGTRRVKELAELTGRWKFYWGSTGEQAIIDIRNGVANRIPLQQHDNRIFWLSNRFAQQHEFIILPGRVIVLGWTTRKGRDPLKSFDMLDAVPDHVGYMTRVAK